MFDGPRPLIFGHRGAAAHAAGNTVAAFRLAREQGADGVELDARRTADGGWVVAHDPGLPGLGLIVDHTVAEITAECPWVPTLPEAFQETRGLLVNLEIKNSPFEPDWDPHHAFVDDLAAWLAQQTGDILVSCFTLGTIDRLRERRDTPPTGWLIGAGADPMVALDEAAARGHQALHPEHSLLPPGRDTDLVAAAHVIGLRIVAWTVDDRSDAQRLAAAGVDAIITNDPESICFALGGR
jgi:glycerophosphoryl diester phosphodiesterase